MIKWIKPNGTEIETNELPKTVAHCESIGWRRAQKKRGPKPKVIQEG